MSDGKFFDALAAVDLDEPASTPAAPPPAPRPEFTYRLLAEGAVPPREGCNGVWEFRSRSEAALPPGRTAKVWLGVSTALPAGHAWVPVDQGEAPDGVAVLSVALNLPAGAEAFAVVKSTDATDYSVVEAGGLAVRAVIVRAEPFRARLVSE